MKKDLGSLLALYPMPVTIVGAMVNGKPNFTTVAHVGIMNTGLPQFISISMNKAHHANKGIKENKAFSVCIPSEDMMAETDYLGIYSGAKINKSEFFKVFHGNLGNVPMIEKCPVCMECSLHDTIDFPNHELFIGKIIGTFAEEDVVVGNEIDFAKVRPILFDMSSRQYWKLGDQMGKAWSVGKNYRKG
ncbi:MAG: Flavin reductase like domain protein [Methanomassiliicoccales archaeon PtaU1.Bin124]|nr:MAG: Flavin reductase like domain protein [Methanomassiliicoccales archaeon PtaU1.Bin124]